METIINYLNTSFEDGILSKAEKKSLKEVISDKKPGKRELDWLRSQIFDLANNKINGLENEKILNWLEEANKLILPKLYSDTYSKVYFSPGPSCLNAVNEQISYATKSIDICVFTISDNRIYDKIMWAYKKGVKIRIITDNDKIFDRGSDVQKLAENGIAIKIDNTSYHMHHKFAVFDNKILLTGSYNWTRSAAEYNQENLLLTNDKNALSNYNSKFEELWGKMDEL